MHWLWWVQIVADVVLIAAVGMLLMRLKNLGDLPRVASPADLENFITEAQSLSTEFDRLLGEKRELVATTLNTLDGRINELQQMSGDAAAQIAAAQKTPPPAAPSAAVSTGQKTGQDKNSLAQFRSKVLELSRQGKKPADIAEQTGKSRGEVELVLGLSGQA